MYIYIGKMIKKLLLDEEELLAQKDEIQLIMDNSDSFVLLYENYKLTFVNKPFLYFFNSESLEAFIQEYESIELLFEETEDTFVCKYTPNIRWVQEIQELHVKERVVAIKHNNTIHFFNTKVSSLKERKNLYIVSFSEITTLYKGAQKDHYDARHDSLTQIFNRKYFDDISSKELKTAQENDTTFSLLMFDIDYFKNVNDTYGHQVGDDVLVHLCKVISSSIRSKDIFARWGGEEFILLLLDTQQDSAKVIAENLRKKIESEDFPTVGTLTCSVGVSEYIKGDTIYSLTSRVDEALYSAKEKNRNRVEVL